MTDIVVTNHAKRRGKERCGLNASAVKNLATKAYVNGIRHKDLHGELKKYIDRICLKGRNINNIRLYGTYVFLFADNVFVTVFHVPNNLLKNLNDTRKKKGIISNG